MIFKCEAPNCDYICQKRSQIHRHHIVPVEQGGSDKGFNRIWLCPNCHSKIFIPSAIHGIHSIKSDNSLILVGWVNSTNGLLLEYLNSSETKYILKK